MAWKCLWRRLFRLYHHEPRLHWSLSSESLKALFRPITVMVPDRQLIMENMLMAEGFVEAKMLAKKFASLYHSSEDMLSPQTHYDWGLRAIKSVLVVAGSLLRAEEGQDESDVLFRALRDFNIPKISAADLVIFTGLLGDLFLGVNPPRKREHGFRKGSKNAPKRWVSLWKRISSCASFSSLSLWLSVTASS